MVRVVSILGLVVLSCILIFAHIATAIPINESNMTPFNHEENNSTDLNSTFSLQINQSVNVTFFNVSQTIIAGSHNIIPKDGSTVIENSNLIHNGSPVSTENGTLLINGQVNNNPRIVELNLSESPVTYRGLEPGSLTLISTSGLSDSYQPKIDGENIVWCKFYPENQTSGIVLYNITTGTEIPLTSQSNLDHANPAISGNYIVYSGQAPDDPIYRIYLYQIDTATTSLLTSPDDQIYRVLPAISGSYAVWSEFETGYGRIVLHNLITDSSLVISADSELLDNSFPSISGDYVVWQAMDSSNSTCSIWLHRIIANETVCLTPIEGSSSQQAPSISGDRIIYADGFGGEWDIMECNISTRERHKISLQKVVNNNPQTAIDGKLVAWVDKSEAYGDIYLFDRMNRTLSLLTPADLNYSSRTGPSISGDRIVWECNNLGNIDIQMFTRGPPADDLIADFSTNQTIGKSPLVVDFKDTSRGSPTAWNWDFGDGDSGAGPEVIHTYLDPGLYSVTLTVNNQRYRNATRKIDLINVATAPEAGFSTNISSGPSPLTVQFGDLSTGSPVTWSWDFGDGESNNTSNPVHIYQGPGVYSPRLLVENDFGNTTLEKGNLIIVLPATQSSSTSGLEGLEVFEKEGQESIAFNITQFTGTYFISPDNRALLLNPSSGSWIKNIVLYSDSGGFTSNPDGFIVGTISNLEVTTKDIQGGSPGGTEFSGSNLRFTINLQSIPRTGELNTLSWDGITSNDLIAFGHAIDYAGFVGITGSAYSIQVTTPGIDPVGNASLRFSVNSSWVEEHGGRDAVYVLRKANDGGLEVLPTTFLENNDDKNLDYFRADSPHGLSTFVISSLHGSGNPLQMFYMSVSSRVAPPVSGGGGGGGSYGGNGNPVTSVSEPDVVKGAQSATAQEGESGEVLRNNGQTTSQSQESVPQGQGLASPVPRDSTVPAANPPVLPPQPTNSIFTLVLEAAAIISVCLLIVFSVYTRNRKMD